MEYKYAQTKLGIVVFIALAIVIFTIIWGKSISIAKQYYEAKVLFNDVTGLERGARVLVSGIPKGKVLDFYLWKEGVVVDIAVAKDVIIYSDAYAYLESPDLMAEKVVAVVPGNSQTALPEGQCIPGMKTFSYARMFSSVDDLGGQLTATLTEVQEVISAFKSFLEIPRLADKLAQTADNLAQASQSLKTMLDTNQPLIDNTMANINQTSADLSELFGRHTEDIDSLFTNITALTKDLRHTIELARQLSISMQDERNTMGKLLSRGDLYEEVLRVTTNLDSLINEIRTKGIKTRVSIF